MDTKGLVRNRGNFYKKKTWRKIRSAQLRKAPLCERCFGATPKRLTIASVCDHVNAEWQSFSEFVAGPFQSLCAICHQDKTFGEDIPQRIKKQRCKMEVKDL